MENLIHIHKEKDRSVFNIIFFLIPILIFVLLVVIITVKSSKTDQVAVSMNDSTAVLGNQAENK